MASSIRASESAREGLRRIGDEEISQLAGILKAGDEGQLLHDLRKGTKLLRALLRLMKGHIPGELRKAESTRWRDLARLLAAAREGEVRLRTFRALVTRPGSCPVLAEYIAQEAAAARRFTFGDRERRALLGCVENGRAAWEGIGLRVGGWKLLGPGLHSSYRAARKAVSRATTESSDDSLHHLRHRVKVLADQLELLAKAKSEKIDTYRRGLKSLGGWLGDDHDLVRLRAFAAERDPACLEMLDPLLRDRREVLQRRAFKQAGALFELRPSEFTAVARKAWRTWRA